MTTPRALGRLELATWQGTHQENQPLVFRIDLPNGWYRVRCASVAHVICPLLISATLAVARRMRYLPALNMDRHCRCEAQTWSRDLMLLRL